jgi:lipid-A-disaccharide synthase
MLLAGETSGDLHGAALVREIRRQNPRAFCFGFGGPQMAAAGMRVDLDLTSRSIIGFWEVFKHLGYFRQAFSQALSLLEQEKPDLVVPIDYPGFNLRFCKAAKARGFRLCYYISPQVWAWKAGRVNLMRRVLDHMLVVFPFEKPLYDQAGLPCTFVGHPLMDRIRPGEVGAAGRRLIGLLPGSREQEVRHLLPVMVETAGLLASQDSRLRFTVVKAPSVAEAVYRPWLRPGIDLAEASYETRRAFAAAMVASGTATLETAILGTPFVILYRVHRLSYEIGRRLIRLPYIGLINGVAGRKVVPEVIQQDLVPSDIADSLRRLVDDKSLRERQKRDMRQAVRTLGGPGASRRAARKILALAPGSRGQEAGGRPF